MRPLERNLSLLSSVCETADIVNLSVSFRYGKSQGEGWGMGSGQCINLTTVKWVSCLFLLGSMWISQTDYTGYTGGQGQ